MSVERTSVRALGEIALRVNDLAKMKAFYRDVLGLDLFREFQGAAFFRIAEGFAGHTAVLVLFDRGVEVGAEKTTVDHIAFTIALEDHEREVERLSGLGLEVTTKTHPWISWRSIYFDDPEGNHLELVCHDPAVTED